MNSGSFRSKFWLMYLLVFAAGVVSYIVIAPGPGSGILYTVLPWVGVLPMLGRLLLDRSRGMGPQWLLAACGTCYAAGILLKFLLHWPSPGPQDAAWVVGSLCGVVGTVWLVRRQMRGRDRESLLDALIIAGGFALLSWVFLIEPATSVGGSLSAGILGMFWPLTDLFLLALLVRMLLGGGLRNPSMRLIAAAQLIFLVSDTLYALVPPEAQGTVFFVVTVGDGLASYGLFGAAALHPAFTSIASERVAIGSERPWLRTTLLCAAVMAGPALLLAQAWQYDSQVPNATAIAVGCAAIFALVVARLQTLIARVKAQSTTLAHQAAHDSLTGLVNRRTLHEQLDHTLATCDGAVLLYVDLDGFKTVNDTAGHEAGDAVLVEVARRLTAAVRGSDVVARLGGDEFAVLCPGQMALDNATKLAQRILDDVALPVMYHGQPYSVGASIGIAVPTSPDIAGTDEGETGDSLLRTADHAMFEAKRLGKGRYVVAHESNPVWAHQPGKLTTGPGTGTTRNAWA